MNLIKEFEQNIPDTIKKALRFCSKAADEVHISIFLIGGIVRDIIINRNNFDVDITVQGNAVEFAKQVQAKYPEICQLKQIHDPFKTAKIEFNIDNECVKIDIASTRKESYPYPASLPVVEEIACELYEDVIRRDFSINSMALSLNQESFGDLIDYLNGYDDLKQGVIHILHDQSFIDDPTRIIRALKFSVRFGYNYDGETQKLMQACLDSGRFDNLAGERIKLELKQSLNLNKAGVLNRFIDENIYRLVDTTINLPKNTDNIEKIVNDYKAESIWLIYLAVLGLSGESMEKLYMSGQEQEIVLNANSLIRSRDVLAKSSSRFEVYEFFEKAGIDSIIAFLAVNPEFKDRVDLYLNELKGITLDINGNVLINMGFKPGPEFGKILREVLKAKINSEINTLEEEISFVRSRFL